MFLAIPWNFECFDNTTHCLQKWYGGQQTRIKLATHVDLKAFEEFLRNKTYPKGILKDKGKKSNFRKPCKNFSIVNGDLMYKEK